MLAKFGMALAVAVAIGIVFFRQSGDTNGAEARRLFDAGARLVDVRRPDEFARGYLSVKLSAGGFTCAPAVRRWTGRCPGENHKGPGERRVEQEACFSGAGAGAALRTRPPGRPRASTPH
jgi:hypothetical protein